jgi:hypothetical protein
VGVTVSGSNASGANPSSYSNGNTGAKISAFVTLNDDFYAGPVETRNQRWKGLDNGIGTLSVADISAVSLVMFTPTGTNGSGGTDMHTVKIQLPSGFKVGNVTVMRSSSDVKSQAEKNVTIGADRESAYISLPGGNIVSLRFTKAQ